MSMAPVLQLSPEAVELQNLLATACQASPALWDSVSSALSAADVAAITGMIASAPPAAQVISASGTAAATLAEGDPYG